MKNTQLFQCCYGPLRVRILAQDTHREITLSNKSKIYAKSIPIFSKSVYFKTVFLRGTNELIVF